VGPAVDCEHGEGECELSLIDRTERLGRRSWDRVYGFVIDEKNLPVLVAGTLATLVLIWGALWCCYLRPNGDRRCCCCCCCCSSTKPDEAVAKVDGYNDSVFGEDRPSTAELLDPRAGNDSANP
jgi:hypothetical protein